MLPFGRYSTSHTIGIIARFEFREHLRNRWLLSYGACFLVLANLILYLGGSNPLQASGSLLSLMLLLVPVFSLIFGSVSFMETLPFMEILAAQPITRRNIYLGKWLGLGSSLSLAFIVGLGLATIMRINWIGQGMATLCLLLALGALLSFVFVSIAFLLANLSNRKEIVFGMALSAWFFFFVLHDLVLFGLVASLGDYPLERLIFVMSLLNPIDLARVLVTLQMDISELMGASGAVMKGFLGGKQGIAFGSTVLVLWSVIPLVIGVRLFNKRNL